MATDKVHGKVEYYDEMPANLAMSGANPQRGSAG
eukprot:CAMPEP_0177636140 /NCGR_PEP_ID=MMETSP0447-20121125/4277_1 /TAXON_ID=0 /ORGANISM="Stygamoeba regulata, Strain BSH-02190019" /LENGTH=33 /DNA_ID= /DNA_START= /DNA_END= /DNA_ORIENTATION=